jgi:hypothetical protein
MGDPTSSYATAGIAHRASGALKPHHHDKVETPSVGLYLNYIGHYPKADLLIFYLCKIRAQLDVKSQTSAVFVNYTDF